MDKLTGEQINKLTGRRDSEITGGQVERHLQMDKFRAVDTHVDIRTCEWVNSLRLTLDREIIDRYHETEKIWGKYK